MILNILLFSGLAETAGTGCFQVEMKESRVSAAKLTEALCEQYPELSGMIFQYLE